MTRLSLGLAGAQVDLLWSLIDAEGSGGCEFDEFVNIFSLPERLEKIVNSDAIELRRVRSAPIVLHPSTAVITEGSARRAPTSAPHQLSWSLRPSARRGRDYDLADPTDPAGPQTVTCIDSAPEKDFFVAADSENDIWEVRAALGELES